MTFIFTIVYNIKLLYIYGYLFIQPQIVSVIMDHPVNPSYIIIVVSVISVKSYQCSTLR